MNRNDLNWLCKAFLTCALMASGLIHSAVAAVYDLNADWSDSLNPNGAWSYRDGAGPISHHVDDWLPGLVGANPQPAWAATGQHVPGHIVSWFKSTNSIFDYGVGDVVVHTWDSINGARAAPAILAWTAPSAGTVDISGRTWLARNIGRAVDWSIVVNGSTLTSGALFDGDPYSRTSAFAFSAGSGGAAALQQVAVAAGDKVELVLSTRSAAGEFTGVGMSIVLTPVPEPAGHALMLAGLLAVGCMAARVSRG